MIGTAQLPGSSTGRLHRAFAAAVVLGLMLLQIGVSGCVGGADSPESAVNATEIEEQTMEVTFELAGMTCEGCVQGVRSALLRMSGVSAAEVTLEPPHARVGFRSGETDEATIRSGIEEIGYEVVSTLPPE